MRFVNNPFTDKLDCASLTGSGAPPIETVTGNSGGPVGPSATFNLNLLGDNTTGLNIVGNSGTNTLTVFGLASSSTQIGTTRYATNLEASAQSSSTVALTPSNITSFFSVSPLPASQGGTGLSSPAANSLLVTNGSSPFTILGVAANGAIPIGSIGSAPVLNTITAGANVTVTNGPGTITIAAAGATATTYTEDTGSATPALNNLNVLGTSAQGISTSGSGSTITITAADATTTTKGVASFNGTNFSVASGAVTSNAITVTSGANITATASWNLGGATSIAVSGTTNHALQLGNAGGSLTSLGVATNGQIPIGSTGVDPVLGTITAGAGISVTNGAGTITLAATGGGISWTDVTGTTQAMAVNNGYTANNAGLVTLTLPATAAYGSVFQVGGSGAGGWLVAQNSGQTIHFGNQNTTTGAGGSLASTNRYDTLELLCITANTDFLVLSSLGNLTVV